MSELHQVGDNQEVTPVQVTREIAQETGVQNDIDIHQRDAAVVDFNRLSEISTSGIYSNQRRNFQIEGILTRCLTCFQQPVAVRNWPCGCICNCLQCADLMFRCAQCQNNINHYNLIG